MSSQRNADNFQRSITHYSIFIGKIEMLCKRILANNMIFKTSIFQVVQILVEE